MKNQAAQAMRSIPSAKREQASRENGKKGGRPKLSNDQRQRLMDRFDADKVRVTVSGEVHVHTNKQRGDGGTSPWWMLAGRLTDRDIQVTIS